MLTPRQALLYLVSLVVLVAAVTWLFASLGS